MQLFRGVHLFFLHLNKNNTTQRASEILFSNKMSREIRFSPHILYKQSHIRHGITHHLPFKHTMTSAGVPVKKVAKAKVPASHPPYATMIVDAVKGLGNRRGSSRQAILKYIVANHSVDAAKASVHVRTTLSKLIAKKVVLPAAAAGKRGAGSFKLAASPKKESVKKPKTQKVSKQKPKKSAKKATKNKSTKKGLKKSVIKKVAKNLGGKKPSAAKKKSVVKN